MFSFGLFKDQTFEFARHFSRTLKLLIKFSGVLKAILDPEMFSDHVMFMFFYALTELAASVPNTIYIAASNSNV